MAIYSGFFPLKMVIFNSYVKLPDHNLRRIHKKAHDSCRASKWCWRGWAKLAIARRGHSGRFFRVAPTMMDERSYKGVNESYLTSTLPNSQPLYLGCWGLREGTFSSDSYRRTSGSKLAAWKSAASLPWFWECHGFMGALKLNSIINPWTIIMLKSHVEDSFLAS